MAVGFYHTIFMYTPVMETYTSDCPYSKRYSAIKDINKPLMHVKFLTHWYESVGNMSDLKLVYYSGGVWYIRSRNPRPMSN